VSLLARALRLTGQVGEDRLCASIGEVVAAVGILRDPASAIPGAGATRPAPAVLRATVTGPSGDRDLRCVEILRQDRDRCPAAPPEPPVRFHVIRCGRDDVVLGLVADPAVLDLRSVYLVLGAVMQAYLGRFRAGQYPPFTAGARLGLAGTERSRAARQAWWLRRLERWRETADAAARQGPGARGRLRTMELIVPADRWAELTAAAGGGGNAGALAVISLLTIWLRGPGPAARLPVFATTLDLRDYAGLGSVIGPLTDRIVFALDLDGEARLTFSDLARRAHAGLLDTVVHYLSYDEVIMLGVSRGLLDPQRPAQLWSTRVDYCANPPASARTRGEETLARRGLSIELFCESALAGHGMPAPPSPGDGTAVEFHVAESGPAAMALVANFDDSLQDARDVSAMLAGLDLLAGKVTAAPMAAVSSL
jgi:hypothetical protein